MRNDLAALVGSRICHDLISPLGAIGNGVELLALTDHGPGEEMALITESVENANARIRFFRIAYGAAAADQKITRAEILSVLTASARGGRFTYFWQIDDDVPRRDVRVAFLALQCIEAAMPLGGDIAVTRSADTWTITATGRRVNIRPELWETLQPNPTNYEHAAAEVQFALMQPALNDSGRKISYDHGPDRLTIRF